MLVLPVLTIPVGVDVLAPIHPAQDAVTAIGANHLVRHLAIWNRGAGAANLGQPVHHVAIVHLSRKGKNALCGSQS